MKTFLLVLVTVLVAGGEQPQQPILGLINTVDAAPVLEPSVVKKLNLQLTQYT